jgi:hypothetical protein
VERDDRRAVELLLSVVLISHGSSLFCVGGYALLFRLGGYEVLLCSCAAVACDGDQALHHLCFAQVAMERDDRRALELMSYASFLFFVGGCGAR